MWVTLLAVVQVGAGQQVKGGPPCLHVSTDTDLGLLFGNPAGNA